ncbi:MAG: hypothetical protein ACUZ8I_09335 [Candidatus Scalindua sp.]
MKDKNNSDISSTSLTITTNQVGFYSAILTTVITMITFGIALTAVPISGPFCPGGCIEYPYLDTLSQFPKDYLWMFPATLLVLVYVTLMTVIHSFAANQKKIFSQIGLSFSIIASVILLADYFIQFSVIPVSLSKGETESISILTQYNPHGVFIVLEELGFLMMSLSFLFISLVFSRKNRLEAAVRWVFLAGFFLTIISLILITIVYGIDRSYRFEVAVISIDWLVLIINGILLSIVFRRRLKAELLLKLSTKE